MFAFDTRSILGWLISTQKFISASLLLTALPAFALLYLGELVIGQDHYLGVEECDHALFPVLQFELATV